MRAVIAVATGLVVELLESLPASEREAGVWLAGFCWAMALHWIALIAVTWWYVAGRGQP